MDSQALKDSWLQVARHGDQVPLFFYSTLFLTHPDTRDLFPVSMAGQRDRLVEALGHAVSTVDRVDSLVPFLQRLGRDHRKFAVVSQHYPAVGEALLRTLEHFLGDTWTPELAQEWGRAYGLVSRVMIDAACEAAKTSPPWWEGRVVRHEQRDVSIAVLTVELDRLYSYLPGQAVSMEVSARPRLWRYYSPANAPRTDNTFDLHVRAVPGGTVSTALVHGTQRGDVIRVGSPVGERLTLDTARANDLLLIAGGTGLAPLKALVEQVAAAGRRKVDLFVGARYAHELYDLGDLRELAAQHPWFTVTPAVSHDPYYPGEHGCVVDVALRHGTWRDRDVFLCGPEAMVQASSARLMDAGVPPEQIHHDEHADDGGQP